MGTFETFQALKCCLRDLDYPSINLLNDEQVADVFSVGNRLAFLLWFLKNMDSGVVLSQDPKQVLKELADIVHESGFCISSQKHKFVQGDLGLDSTSQLKIIRRMLNYLSDIQPYKENMVSPAKPEQGLSCDDINKFLTKDLNLFPAYGPIKLLNVKNRQDRQDLYEHDIEKVKRKIEKLEMEENLTVDYDTSSKQVDNRKITLLEGDVLNFKDCTMTLLKHKSDSKDDLLFSKKVEDCLVECNEEIKNVVKYIDSMNTIGSFTEKIDLRHSYKENENFDIIKSNAKFSGELLKGTNKEERY